MAHILCIEDDIEIGNWLKHHIQSIHGYQVTWIENGEEAFKYIHDVDIVLLDLMLSGLDGFTVGKRIKKKRNDISILILSARTAIEDKLQGLEFADDYITKPFHPDELVARIKILLRKKGHSHKVWKPSPSIEVDFKEGIITHQDSDDVHQLTGKEKELLEFMYNNANQILTKKEIYQYVWGREWLGDDNTIMVHIRRVRQKIESNPNNPRVLQTVRGIGYRVVI